MASRAYKLEEMCFFFFNFFLPSFGIFKKRELILLQSQIALSITRLDIKSTGMLVVSLRGVNLDFGLA